MIPDQDRLVAEEICKVLPQKADVSSALFYLRQKMAEGFDLLLNANYLLSELKETYRSSEKDSIKAAVLENAISFILKLQLRSETSNKKMVIQENWMVYAEQVGAPLITISVLDCFSEDLARNAVKNIAKNDSEKANSSILLIFKSLDEIFNVVKMHLPIHNIRYRFALLYSAIGVFAKYQICGLKAEEFGMKEWISEVERRLLNPIQEDIQKLIDLKVFDSKMQESFGLASETGKLLLSYAEILFHQGQFGESQSYAKAVIEICLNSKYTRVLADAYNLLGRICMQYSDEKSLLEAEKYFEGSIKILDERLDEKGIKEMVAGDHANLAEVYIGLHNWFESNHIQSRDFLTLAEQQLLRSKELAAESFVWLNTQSHLLEVKGDLEGSKNLWKKTVEEYQDCAKNVLTTTQKLSIEDASKLKLFTAAVHNLASLFLEKGIALDGTLESTRNDVSNSIELLIKYPEINDNASKYCSLLSDRAQLSFFLNDFSDAYLYYKKAGQEIEEQLQRTPNLVARMNIVKKYEYLYMAFADCCYQLIVSDPENCEEYFRVLYFVISRVKQSLFLFMVAFQPLKPPEIRGGTQTLLLKKETELINRAKPYMIGNPSSWSPEDNINAANTMRSLVEIWNELNKYSPDYVSVRRASPLTLKDLLKLF